MSRDNLDDSRTPDVLSETNGRVRQSQTDNDSISSDSEIYYNIDLGDLSHLDDGESVTFHEYVEPAPMIEFHSISCGEILSAAAYHVTDWLRITFVTQALLSRWAHQLFLELERYEHSPSLDIQKTWLGYPIFGVAVLLGVIAKTVNAIYGNEKYLAAQDYVFAIFCSAIFYFFLDLWSGAQSMPLGIFIASSAIVLPLAAAFFVNLALPDSDNRFYVRLADLDYIPSLRYSANAVSERTFNFISGMGYGATSLTTLFWTINREIHGKTVALPWWQMLLVGTGVLGASKIGYDLTDHPIRFQQMIMGAKFLKDGALTYAAVSGILYMLCHDKQFYSDLGVKVLLSCLCGVLALCVGFYSLATTRFRFEENCEGIEKTVLAIRQAPETIANGLASIGNNISRFFTSCCRKVGTEAEEGRLLLVQV